MPRTAGCSGAQHAGSNALPRRWPASTVSMRTSTLAGSRQRTSADAAPISSDEADRISSEAGTGAPGHHPSPSSDRLLDSRCRVVHDPQQRGVGSPARSPGRPSRRWLCIESSYGRVVDLARLAPGGVIGSPARRLTTPSSDGERRDAGECRTAHAPAELRHSSHQAQARAASDGARRWRGGARRQTQIWLRGRLSLDQRVDVRRDRPPAGARARAARARTPSSACCAARRARICRASELAVEEQRQQRPRLTTCSSPPSSHRLARRPAQPVAPGVRRASLSRQSSQLVLQLLARVVQVGSSPCLL